MTAHERFAERVLDYLTGRSLDDTGAICDEARRLLRGDDYGDASHSTIYDYEQIRALGTANGPQWCPFGGHRSRLGAWLCRHIFARDAWRGYR